jgi:ribosomal protein S18 acetylase RimI-like enzyme
MYRPIDPAEPFSDELAPEFKYASVLAPEILAQWIQLINQSGEFPAYGTWDQSILERLILKTVVPGGAILVLDSKDDLVGCLSLCRTSATSAQFMYVLVDPKHRGRGLGPAMAQRALKVAQANSIRKVTLLTDPTRIAAVRLYLRTGFVPDLQVARDAGARWSRVFEDVFKKTGTDEPEAYARTRAK